MKNFRKGNPIFVAKGLGQPISHMFCEIGIKALKNFPSMLDDGDCTNIVFIENLSHEETSDAAKSMFVNFVSDTTCAKYFTHISIRY